MFFNREDGGGISLVHQAAAPADVRSNLDWNSAEEEGHGDAGQLASRAPGHSRGG